MLCLSALRLRLHLASFSLSSFLFSFLPFPLRLRHVEFTLQLKSYQHILISTSRNCLLNMNFKVIEVG